MGEKPTVETPVEEPKAEATGQTEIEALLKTLEKAGVTTTQELQGKLTASREAGQLANLLGDANKRIADLEQASRMPTAEPEYDYSEGTPIDIESIVEKKLSSVLDAREAKTRRAQHEAMKIWQGIQTDKDYGLVKEVWEQKIKDSNFNMDIQSGSKNIATEYMETVREYYKGIARQSLETITQLQKGGAMATPHVEGEAQISHDFPADMTKGQETIKKVQEKVNKGGRLTEDEELAALDAILKGS
jgi:hypothetical protein